MTLVETSTGRLVVLLSLPGEDPVRFRYVDDLATRTMSLIQFTSNGWFVAAA